MSSEAVRKQLVAFHRAQIAEGDVIGIAVQWPYAAAHVYSQGDAEGIIAIGALKPQLVTH